MQTAWSKKWDMEWSCPIPSKTVTSVSKWKHSVEDSKNETHVDMLTWSWNWSCHHFLTYVFNKWEKIMAASISTSSSYKFPQERHIWLADYHLLFVLFGFRKCYCSVCCSDQCELLILWAANSLNISPFPYYGTEAFLFFCHDVCVPSCFAHRHCWEDILTYSLIN